MRRTYPTEQLEKENDELTKAFMKSEGISLEDFIQQNASEEFKQYLIESQKRKKRLWEEKGEIEE